MENQPNRYLPEWIKNILPESVSRVDWTPVWLHGFVAFIIYSAVNLGATLAHDNLDIVVPGLTAALATTIFGFGREMFTGWRKNGVINFLEWSLRKNVEWVIFPIVAMIMEFQV